MPRPKVLEEYRQRTAKACLNCQTAKQKCDGLAPCIQCLKRGRSNSCTYSTRVRFYGRRRKHVGSISQRQVGRPSSDGDLSPESDGVGEPMNRMTDIAIPKLPHNIYDTRGRVPYLGDCAALSFLQHIQQLIEGEGELATIAADVGSFRVYEEVPPVRCENILEYNTTNIQDIKELVDVFFESTCGILDIFGRGYVEELLSRWAIGSLETDSGSAAILYLTIAYAAQARCATVMDVHRAQSFYDRGRQIALLELTNDPSLETVQAFILISLYMLGCSRRNGAYLNLGIAISAAKSLGCHRHEANANFPEQKARLRKRVWRTLRYHDLFFCAMMGRTSAILTTDSTVLDEQQLPNSNFPDFCQELGLLESARAFSFLERTVNEVYTKQTVPLGLLQRMSQELQETSSRIPAELRTVQASNTSKPQISRQNIMRNASVACNYYFSMMLLTRPFLITGLRAKCSRSTTAPSKNAARANITDAKIYTDIMHGATTSIDSAIKTIQLLHELMTADILFNNMPLAVAWAFVAALTVCSAYFGRLGVVEEYERAIQQVDEILQHFARNSPQARRYSLILKKLSKAALDYVKRLEHKGQATQDILMPELFRLNPTQSAYSNDGCRVPMDTSPPITNHTKRAPTSYVKYSYFSQSEGNQVEPLAPNSETFGHRKPGGTSNQANVSTMGDSESLLDLAYTFHDLSSAPLDMSLDPEGGCINEHFFDFDNTQSIWDVSWGESIL